MKITIVGRPEFQLELDLATVEVLCFLSSRHYDATCRQASLQGGFLFGWANRLTWYRDDPDSGEPPRCIASWSELDLTLKICELGSTFHKDSPKRTLVWEYMKKVGRILSLTNQFHGDWKKDLEV